MRSSLRWSLARWLTKIKFPPIRAPVHQKENRTPREFPFAVWRGPISFHGDQKSRGCFMLERVGQRAHIGKSSWHDSIILNFQCGGRRRRCWWQRRRGASSHKHAASGSTDRSIDWHLRCLSSAVYICVCVCDNKPNFILPRGGRLE